MSADVVALRPDGRVETYAVLSQEAREAHAKLRGLQSRLDRIFAGNFTTATAKAEIQHLTDEIGIFASSVLRLTQ